MLNNRGIAKVSCEELADIKAQFEPLLVHRYKGIKVISNGRGSVLYFGNSETNC